MFLRGTFVMANDTKTHDALVADWKAKRITGSCAA
jgi:hypothetical protein